MWSTKCGFAYGLMMTMGTRMPSGPYGFSLCGGGTWSYQHPQSSYVRKMAVEPHVSGFAATALTTDAIQFSPLMSENVLCCELKSYGRR